MKIYTSYAAKLEFIRINRLVPVLISSFYRMDTYNFLKFPKFYYNNEAVKHQIDPHWYKETYRKKINQLNQQDVYSELYNLASADDIVLVTNGNYKTDLCHRHIIAEWFSEINLTVLEFENQIQSSIFKEA